MNETPDDLIKQIRAEADGWRGSNPVASKARYQKLVSRRRLPAFTPVAAALVFAAVVASPDARHGLTLSLTSMTEAIQHVVAPTPSQPFPVPSSPAVVLPSVDSSAASAPLPNAAGLVVPSPTPKGSATPHPTPTMSGMPSPLPGDSGSPWPGVSPAPHPSASPSAYPSLYPGSSPTPHYGSTYPSPHPSPSQLADIGPTPVPTESAGHYPYA